MTCYLTQKLLDHAKQSATDALRTTSKKEIQKTAEPTRILIGNNFATKITKNSQQKNSKNFSRTEEKLIEIPKERFKS